MKKNTYFFLLIFVLNISFMQAKPVHSSKAKIVAENFFRTNSKTGFTSVDLAYTQLSANGTALYYAFNVDNNQGFVIVTADDEAEPVIAYSYETGFVTPESTSPAAIWLKKRGEEISKIISHSITAKAEYTQLWDSYLKGTSTQKSNGTNSTNSAGVAPIIQSTWNQSPNYNALCPGGSVTGCVATAMAQIMLYWKYPLHGTGSSSYTHPTYGLQSANYANATYNWANMPMACMTANNDVATINYHCGVSVNMDYSPSGSGANVIGGSVSAQHSFTAYFKYNASTIKGKYRSSYADNAWITLMKSDLDIGRPIQYVGWDPNGGGHTWVCDGYDQNDFLHMNWGWGGQSNGYFSINNMAPTGSNFSDGHQALMGIVPIAANTLDAGVSMISAPSGSYCSGSSFTPTIKLQNFGANTLTACTINYQIDNNPVQTQSWTGSLVTGQFDLVTLPTFSTAGGYHTITCYSSNPNSSTDADNSNNQTVNVFTVNTAAAPLPLVEGFESVAIPSASWASTHTAGVDWAIASNSASSGVKSCMIDNMSNVAGAVSTLDNFNAYDMSAMSNPSMTFKLAYQRKATTNNDRLQLYVSINCGANWTLKWSKAGAALASVTTTGTTAFTPAATDYVTATVNLITVAYKPSVMFRWVFNADANGVGNNLFIDDINIFNSAVGISAVENNVGLNVYPNPSATGKVNLAFNLTEKHNITVSVIDMLGRTAEIIDSKSYQAGETILTVGTKHTYEPGVYFANICIDGKVITKKIVIQ